MHTQLKTYLKCLIEPAGQPQEALMEAIQGLDKIYAEQKETLPKDLAHYLQRRSYSKALAYLEGESDIPPGICGGKH